MGTPMSTLVHALDNDPERMTGRARAYLAVNAARHIAFGVLCLLAGQAFSGERFSFIYQILHFTMNPIFTWGVIFIATGCVSGFAALRKKEALARSALIISCTVTSFWAFGLAVAASYGYWDAAGGSILFTSLVLKDIIVSRQPLRSPFEAVMRRVGVRQQQFEATQAKESEQDGV